MFEHRIFVTDWATKLLGIVHLTGVCDVSFTPLRGLLLACVTLAGPALAADPLRLEVYNPGHEAIFPVSSVIVSGEHDAILVDAQFGKAQAEQLVQRLRAGGKQLTTIYISHGDPDYYFGLDTLTQAFPDAKVLASAATVAHIRQTMDAKLAYWGPQMGADKPARLVLPQVLEGNRLTLEGQDLEVVGSTARNLTAVLCGSRRSRRWSVAWWCRRTFMCGWPTRKRPSPTPTGSAPWRTSKRWRRVRSSPDITWGQQSIAGGRAFHGELHS